MDNRETSAPCQPERSVTCYTIDELLARMEPQYREYKNTIRQCIVGLTGYAAQLAAKGQEEQVPTLGRLIVEMVEFWGLAEDDTPKGFQEMSERYRREFDGAVSAARDSACILELSEQAKETTLAGLELYAREMLDCGDMGQWIDECDTLADQLRAEWKMESSPPQPSMGGMC